MTIKVVGKIFKKISRIFGQTESVPSVQRTCANSTFIKQAVLEICRLERERSKTDNEFALQLAERASRRADAWMEWMAEGTIAAATRRLDI